MPEVEHYLKMNQDQIRAANKTNSYGGGGKIGWAPNLLATTTKPIHESVSINPPQKIKGKALQKNGKPIPGEQNKK